MRPDCWRVAARRSESGQNPGRFGEITDLDLPCPAAQPSAARDANKSRRSISFWLCHEIVATVGVQIYETRARSNVFRFIVGLAYDNRAPCQGNLR